MFGFPPGFNQQSRQGQRQGQELSQQQLQQQQQQEEYNKNADSEYSRMKDGFDKYTEIRKDLSSNQVLTSEKKKSFEETENKINSEMNLINKEQNRMKKNDLIMRLGSIIQNFISDIKREERQWKLVEKKKKFDRFFLGSKRGMNFEDIAYKFFGIIISIFAIKLGTSRMNAKYIENVVAQDIEPPSMINSLGLIISMDIIFNICFLVVINIIGQRNKTIGDMFNQNYSKFIADYIGYLISFTVISGIIAYQFSNKKYFRYREDGTRGIRALDEILIYISIFLHLIPFYTIVNLFADTSEAGAIKNEIEKLLDCDKKFLEKKNEISNITGNISSIIYQSKDNMKELISKLKLKISKEDLETSKNELRIQIVAIERKNIEIKNYLTDITNYQKSYKISEAISLYNNMSKEHDLDALNGYSIQVPNIYTLKTSPRELGEHLFKKHLYTEDNITKELDNYLKNASGGTVDEKTRKDIAKKIISDTFEYIKNQITKKKREYEQLEKELTKQKTILNHKTTNVYESKTQKNNPRKQLIPPLLYSLPTRQNGGSLNGGSLNGGSLNISQEDRYITTDMLIVEIDIQFKGLTKNIEDSIRTINIILNKD